uniref:Hydroxysteroid (17-beta) dehydrogenase 8 n=1 Tax=Oncorhynchus tshawytscha TaxID=74940 RepID=A0AAZ3QDL8_ONCTS
MPTTTRLISRLTDITAICQQFTSEGATVVVADIREESALGILNHGHKGQDHITAAVDVSIKGDNTIEKLEICRYFQPPSVCVNAAGVTQDDFSLKMEDEDFGKVTQATFLLTKAVGKALVASGAPKRSIIAVGSIVGKSDILTNGPPASKAVVEGLTRTAANYRFNCLPGFITTPMTDKLTSMVPLGRMGEPAGRNTVYTTLYAIDHTTNAELCTFSIVKL